MLLKLFNECNRGITSDVFIRWEIIPWLSFTYSRTIGDTASISLIELWNCRSDYVKAHFLLERSRIEKRGKREFCLMKKHSKHHGDNTRLFMNTLLEVSIFVLAYQGLESFFLGLPRALCTRSVALFRRLSRVCGELTVSHSYPCDVLSNDFCKNLWSIFSSSYNSRSLISSARKNTN